MAEHCPALLDRAATAFQGKDWLYFCCTQERATDPASAAAAFGDFRTGAYDARVLELLRLPEIARLLPEIVDGTRHHGELSAAAAAATGLIAGTPVVLGPVDLIAIALAAGLAQPDARLGCTILGGGGVHMRAGREPPRLASGPAQIGAVMPFAALWFKVAQGPARVVAEWLVDLAAELLADAGLIGIGRAELVAILEQKAAAAAPATLRLDPGAPEADHAPAPAGFLGISGATTFYDLLRSIYEGQGLAARACYDALGGRPRRDPHHRRRRGEPPCPPGACRLRRRAAARVPARDARRGRRRPDRRGRARPLPRPGRRISRLGRPASRRPRAGRSRPPNGSMPGVLRTPPAARDKLAAGA